jgi:hypothetical protein
METGSDIVRGIIQLLLVETDIAAEQRVVRKR